MAASKISFSWPYLPIGVICFSVGLVAGLLWHLPFDQASTIVGLIVGLLVGVIGVAATLWASAHDRGLKLGEIQRDVSEVKSGINALQTSANVLWTPVLTAIANAQYGTSNQPVGLGAVQQEQNQPAPRQSLPEQSPASQEGGQP